MSGNLTVMRTGESVTRQTEPIRTTSPRTPNRYSSLASRKRIAEILAQSCTLSGDPLFTPVDVAEIKRCLKGKPRWQVEATLRLAEYLSLTPEATYTHKMCNPLVQFFMSVTGEDY